MQRRWMLNTNSILLLSQMVLAMLRLRLLMSREFLLMASALLALQW